MNVDITFRVLKRHSTQFHPGEMGRQSRQTEKQIMRCMLEDRNLEDAWPSILQETSHALNSMSKASTGYSPFRIIYGKEPRQLVTSKVLLQNKPLNVSVEDSCDEIGSREHYRRLGRTYKWPGKERSFYDRGKTTCG